MDLPAADAQRGGSFPHEDFAHFQFGQWGSQGPLLPAGETVTTFMQTCLVAAQTLGWHSVGEISRWPHWRPEAEGPRRHPAYNVIRLSEGVELNWELKRQLIVKPDVALVWGLCNGQAEDDIVKAAVSLSDAAPDLTDLNESRVRAVIASLEQKSLLATAR